MDDTNRRAEHLRVLSILNYVYAGLCLLGSCGGIFYLVMGGMFARLVERQGNNPHSAEAAEAVGGMMVAFGFLMTCFAVLGAVLSFLSARWMGQHRNRTFSLITAGLQCLAIPLGTILGIFTFVVLSTPEAEELYAAAERQGSPPPG
jgi:hypothetical protein